jgi:DNA-binding response OmpR family regulator
MFVANLLSAGSGDQTLRTRIAIVEDEPDLREAVADYLTANGFDVTPAGSAAEMRALLESRTFDLAILDIAMPGEDGLSLGRWLRSRMPIGLIFATAAGTSIDRVVGLELGADDYLVKPYELREMLARVRSVLRRLPPESAPAPADAPQAAARRVMSFGEFRADLDSRTVTGPAGPVDLAKSEFDVLEVFLARPNRVLSRSAIFDAIGNQDDAEASRALDLRIMRLRRKIEADPANPRFLRTVRGEGYIFAMPVTHGPTAHGQGA